ncbi:MAG: DUF4838 domain-containing protein [Lentisphaeria bacterium]|nr:DUF4838 domain-containing protein [Lentisphaeria bacterium]
MRKFFGVLLLAAAAFSLAGAELLPFRLEPKYPRKIKIGTRTVMQLVPGNFEIVRGSSTHVVEFAAQEMADALSAVFGTKIRPVRKSTGKKYQIRIGDEKLAKELRLDLADFDRDGFVIRTIGNTILIIGRDNPKSRPVRDAYKTGNKGEWATLFGVYDFLERFAGVRYYFPGKLGNHFPAARELNIPELDIYDRPDFLQRRFTDYNHGGRPIRRYPGWQGQVNMLRSRAETVYIPNCHGIAYLGYYYRFGKTKPEYFALNVNGKRMIEMTRRYDASQICFSSGIKQEIIKDALSFLKNEGPEVRGIRNIRGESKWNNVHRPGLACFNIMPNDSAYFCRCKDCWAHFSKGKQATTDFFWQFFIDICDEVKKSGIPGYLTTMAYADYRPIPTQKIPDNLLVMLALRGPWNEYLPANQAKDIELLKAWQKKLGQKTWIWTYPGKYGGNMPGIPHTTPRSLSSFIKRARPYIFGIFIECESDVLMHNYLTYHVFGKLAWDPDTDVEKLLDEHAKVFYGPAAVPMKEFFDTIERNWKKIAANVVETSAGPVTIFPSELVLWSKIYTPDELKRINGLFDKAEKLAAKNKLIRERIKFVRKEFMEPLMAEACKFHSANDAVKSWAFPVVAAETPVKIDGKLDDAPWKKTPALYLSAIDNKPVEVMSVAKMTYDKDNYYFCFKWDEPKTEKIAAADRKFDDSEIWQDSTAELFISPDGNREHYYQILVNARGAFTDLEVTKGVENHKWNSGAEVKTFVEPGKGWNTEIRIPRKNLSKSAPDGIRINFARYRVLSGEKVGTAVYSWSPFVRKLSEVSRFGKLLFKAPAEKPNLLRNADFDPAQIKNGAWSIRPERMDSQYFMTAGNSLKLNCGKRSSVACYQYMPQLKPNAEYEVNFYVKLDNVKKLDKEWSGFYVRFDYGNGKCRYFPAMPVQMEGSCSWTGFQFRSKTPEDCGRKSKPYINFILRKASGTAWVDHVSVREVTR